MVKLTNFFLIKIVLPNVGFWYYWIRSCGCGCASKTEGLLSLHVRLHSLLLPIHIIGNKWVSLPPASNVGHPRNE